MAGTTTTTTSPTTDVTALLNTTRSNIARNMNAQIEAQGSKCVVTTKFGISHPYAYCVKPSGKMVGTEFTDDKYSMKNTEKVLAGLWNYVDYITVKADKGTRDECRANSNPTSQGIVGNKYVLKTNIACRVINSSGTISGENVLHKYIDNTTTLGSFLAGGEPQDEANGLLPSTFASAGKIGYNVVDVISAFAAESKPYCMEARLNCHIIDSQEKENTYRGPSSKVYLSVKDIKDIDSSSFFNNNKPVIPPIAKGRLGFTNLIDNIISENNDKIQGLSEFENALNTINFQDELLVKTYYIGFSIFLIILIFKLINKK
jgi:hypothetical protein